MEVRREIIGTVSLLLVFCIVLPCPLLTQEYIPRINLEAMFYVQLLNFSLDVLDECYVCLYHLFQELQITNFYSQQLARSLKLST